MTERARAEMQARAQQSKIRRLDQTRVEDDPVGLFTQAQRDMFDDPAGPQAREWQLSLADDLRTQIERDGDAMVDMGDGTGSRSMTEILNEMDADDEFNAILDLCGKGGN